MVNYCIVELENTERMLIMKSLKKLFCIIAFSLILAITAMASEKVTLPSFDVTFNGQKVSSETRQYPLVVYKDITYIPMTYYDTRFLGLTTEWDNATRTVSIQKAGTVIAYREYSSGNVNKTSDTALICPFNIVVNGKTIDNSKEEYPLLVYRDVTYFPLTWRFAVEEFGWSYHFSFEKGLVITSDNKTLTKFTLPDMRANEPSVATDGKYWYYTGNNNKIYRLLREDWAANGSYEPEVIHTLEYTYYPDTTLVSFSYWEGNVFMTYHTGGASTGTTYRYQINSDGSCERSTEGTYYYGMIGANAYNIDADGFTVERYNSGRVGTSTIYYRFDGSEEYIEIKQDGIRFGEHKNADMSLNSDGTLLGTNSEGNTWFNDPQVIGSKIYLTGYDENSDTNSALYVCDTKTGEIKKLVDNVGVFYAFSGWDNAANAMVDMIVYDRQGTRYRYSTYNANELVIDTNVRPMKMANLEGGYCLAVVGDDGSKAEVIWYDGYGSGSVNNKIYETDSGTEFYVTNGNLCAYNYSPSNVKLAVFHLMSDYFVTAENVQNVFVTDHSVLFTVADEKVFVFEVELD